MKASGKITKCMAKVRNKWLLYDLLILTMIDDLIGKLFGNNGDRYEGEFKDDKMHGQGKKQVINLWLIYSNIVWWFDR